LKNVQEEKKLRQAQLEPLQEGVEKMLIEMDESKGQIENLRFEDK
jgi:hypothetical protein